MPDPKIFKLAPMAKAFKAITFVYAAMTVAFLMGMPFGRLGILVGAFLAGVALVIWAWMRPKAFVVDGESLVIQWQLRRRRIPLASISAVERVDTRDFGTMIRVGAGGVWGAFGMFFTRRDKWIDGYFSILEGLVLLRLKDQRPLLISPDDKEAFIKGLGI